MKSASFVRFYFLSINIIGFILMLLIILSANGYMKLAGFIIFAVLVFCIFQIKCESCGAIMYRRDKKTHGFPTYQWEKVTTDSNCPCCGIERYGFWDGLGAFFSQKK